MSEHEPAKRRALGKGLESLLPRAAAPRITEVPAAAADLQPEAKGATGSALEIVLEQIDRNPFQTRKRFDDKQLIELAASISATGVVQPILVRPLPNGRYQLIAGERRWLASKLANKSTIPAIVKQVSDGQSLEMTIVENLQRADLNAMEQARAYERLGREFRLTQEQMAQRTGKDRATVGNFLRLLKLPPEVQAKVEAGELTFGHAKALLALEDPELILKAAQKVGALSMSVRHTESYVQGLLHPGMKESQPGKLKQPLDPNVREARDALQAALGLRVTIEDKQGKGRVIIEYARLEDFDSLMEMLVQR